MALPSTLPPAEKWLYSGTMKANDPLINHYFCWGLMGILGRAMTFFYANPTVRESPQYLPTHPRKRPASWQVLSGEGSAWASKVKVTLQQVRIPRSRLGRTDIFSRSELSYREFLAKIRGTFPKKYSWVWIREVVKCHGAPIFLLTYTWFFLVTTQLLHDRRCKG